MRSFTWDLFTWPNVALTVTAKEEKLFLPFAEFLHAGSDPLNLGDGGDSKTAVVFIFHIQPFSVNIRETECPYSLVNAHLSKAHPLTI